MFAQNSGKKKSQKDKRVEGKSGWRNISLFSRKPSGKKQTFFFFRLRHIAISPFTLIHDEPQTLAKFVSHKTERKKRIKQRKAEWSHAEAARQLTTVISSLSNHCSLSSARGHMSGLRADFIRLTQRRDSSSPGDPATLLASFTYQGEKSLSVSVWDPSIVNRRGVGGLGGRPGLSASVAASFMWLQIKKCICYDAEAF